MAIEPVISYLRIRVVATFNSGNKEITNDLPHLHQTHIDVVAFQPGNPGSSALGSFSIPLHPPGTEGYAAAKAIYDQLDYIQRVECYISHDGKSLGKLYYAGIITGIRKAYGQNPVFELTGVADTGLANLSKPFPGEYLLFGYTAGGGTPATYRQARNFFGTNELGAADNFNPFTIGNYTSTNLPSLTSGTWTGTTDDGLTVASCSTGTGAVLLSKTGAIAGDSLDGQYVEISGRLAPSTDATNAGKFGVGLSKSNANCNDCVVVYAVAYQPAGHWKIDVHVDVYTAGVLAGTTFTASLTDPINVLDPVQRLPLTLGLWVGGTGGSPYPVAVTVNGKLITNGGTTTTVNGLDFGVATAYPFLFYGTPASGSAISYHANLIQEVRVADDLSTAAFKSGTIGSPAASLDRFSSPGPTFLEVWSRAATREGWYWRYTPQAYTVGTRTLGTVDFTADPGTDRGTSKSVVFSSADGTLVDLQVSANADQFVAATVAAGTPGSGSGGIAPWRDIATMQKYGVVEDQILSVLPVNFSELRRAAYGANSNRINLGSAGSKTAVVLRDPRTADVWRELDKVMIHCPEIGINYLVARVLAYTFDEGHATQTLTLDQFSTDDPTIPMRRLQQGNFQMAILFNTR